MIRVLMATTWKVACGISDFGEQLKQAVEAADAEIVVTPMPQLLDPDALSHSVPFLYDVLFLNHHDALHARWTVEKVQAWKAHMPVVCTYHDTFSGEDRPNSDKAKALAALCDAFIVHEPVTDLPGAILIRHGVPKAEWPMQYGVADRSGPAGMLFKQYWQQPVLGTVGFNFVWKEMTRLCEESAKAGWAIVLLSNNATEEDEARWRSLNPWSFVVRQFLPQPEAVSYLAGCDATIFAYQCSNAGTSGAIRQGLAARKPLIAWSGCRQFFDIKLAEGGEAIHWCPNFDELPQVLRNIPIGRTDPGIIWLAERDSWTRQGRRYAEIFRRVAEERS